MPKINGNVNEVKIYWVAVCGEKKNKRKSEIMGL